MKNAFNHLLFSAASIAALVSFVPAIVSAQESVSLSGQVFDLIVDSRLVREGVVVSACYSKKLGSNAKLRLSELSADENSLESILVRISGKLTSEQQSQLTAMGAEIRTVAGDIVTITTPLRTLSQLAELDFVTYIELSTSLYPESERN